MNRSVPPAPWPSLVELLCSRAQLQPHQRAFTFLDRDGREEAVLSYRELDHRARLVAATLQQTCKPGDRALLLHAPGIDYLTAFFGCLYAGVVAVPSYPPNSRNLNRLRAIVADARPTVALTDDRIMAAMARRLPDAAELRAVNWLPTAALTGDAAQWTDPGVGTDSLAFLQYTSGSTATPKGVMVSHGNLLANSAQIHRRLGISETSLTVSWLPPFHDMGLIGGILQPLVAGGQAVLMAPGTFVLDPVQWLRAISTYGATESAAPPFALDLCVERVDPAELEPLDLSTLATVIVGAEPVRPETLDRFAERFARWGLRRGALRPGFGLAEGTLMVSCGEPLTRSADVTVNAAALEAHHVLLDDGAEGGGQAPRGARTLAGCGSAVDGQRLLVVDPSTATVCGPDRVGEIWLAGPNVAQGYWERPAESEHTFGGQLATGEGPFLRTGDLGFLRAGELFVTGRSKDLIIVRGRNLYPQDLELCAERSHPVLQPNSSAAVTVEVDGVEQLLLIAEVRRGVDLPPAADVARAVGREIAAEFEVGLHGLVLVRATTVPKTSSGKIRRRAARQSFLDGTLAVVGEWTSGEWTSSARPLPAVATPGPTDRHRAATEEYVSDLVATVVPDLVDRPGPGESLLDLGLDSLATLRLIGRIERELDIDVAELVTGGGLTVAELADAILARRPHGPAPTERGGPQRTRDTDPSAPFPLTDTQQAYCLGRTDAFELGNVSTHAYLEFDAPDLDLSRFEHAWRRMIERHDMLRAVILPDTNQQRILPEVPPYEIRVTDLSGRERQEVAAELAATRERLSHEVRPADRWPLFEVAATRLDDGLRIHLSLDALIADFGSGRLLFDELSRFYQEPDDQLPRPAGSFKDYVQAEAELRESPEYRRSREYWWSRLPELPPAPQLPSAVNARSVRHPRFTRRESRLPAELWEGLKQRAARAGLTPTGLLIAVYAEVLATWSNRRHFTINVPRLNRIALDPDFDGVIGQFASFTLLEIDHRAGGSFEDRAREVQRRLREDLRHEHVSGVEVLRELMKLQGGFDQALMPVVMTSTLAFSAADRTPLERLLTPVFGISQTPQVSLDSQVQEEEGALLLHWDAVDALFPTGLVDDMFAAHHALLHDLATEERTWSRTAPLALPAAQAARRETSSGRDREIPAVQVQSLFEAQAARRPDAPAVIAPDRTLSYAELADGAREVGRWLRAHGARRNSLVAIVMDKGWEQVVAAYGVLFSGAAYLPIDPELPTGRLHQLLDRGEVGLILTQSRLDEALAWPAGPLRLCVDRPLPSVADDGVPPATPHPDDLVYTMFTSGSTGLPKGVMISHRALVNCLSDTVETFGIGEGDRCLALTALHHDLSAFDLFGVLGAGGTVVLPAAADRREAAHWGELIAEHGVTVWNSVPAMMEMLLESLAHRADGAELVEPLRLVILGGDWIPPTVPRRLARLVDGIEVVSIGGPTETTVWSIWYRIGKVDPAWRSIPYGTPIANVRYHVLDEGLRDCPDWVTGQQYVSGACLADGYWRDEERTAAVFTTHPRTGERMYATGDLGRWLPDGTIEFVGRADFQVKIRGQRIELGEIEAELLAHPDVASAVVTATSRPERPGHDGLVAYVIPKPGAHGPAPEAGDVDAARRAGITLVDPVDRAEFKLARHGLRREPDRPRLDLPRTPASQDAPQGAPRRRSDRDFLAEPITLAELADCLGCLRQVKTDGPAECRYPSGGGLYPVQAYLHVKRGAVVGLPAGTYYYDPDGHALVTLVEDAVVPAAVHAAHNRAIFEAAGFGLLFVADPAAIEPMYGSLARDLCLVEAGYLGQLLMEWAARNEVGLCPIGELTFDQVRPLFALDDRQLFVHAMLGGRVDRTAPARKPAPVQPAADRLRGWLSDRLPAHLVPDHVLTLDSWPLSANGKLDRRALPAPKQSADLPGFVAPRTPTEEGLAALWCEVLELPRVGVRDNFFELGGHSLAATRLVTRVRDRFGAAISLRDVFTARTVADLAVTVDRLVGEVVENV